MNFRWIVFGLLGMAFGVFGQEIPATNVNLSVKDEPVENVFKKITEASGNLTMTRPVENKKPSPSTQLIGVDGPKMDFEAKDEAYWSVVRRFCEVRGMTVVQPQEEYRDSVYLMPGDGILKMPTAMSGGCMFQIKGAKVNQRQEFKGDPSRTVEFEMLMYSEPKAGIFKVAGSPTVEQALADNGKSMAIKSGNEDPKFADAASPTWHRFELNVNYEPGVKRLKTLSGKIWVIQEVKSEDWTIEETGKAAGMKKTICDLDALKITKLAVENNFVVLEMEISAAGQQEETLLSPEAIMRRVRYEGPENQPDLRSNLADWNIRREGGKVTETFKIQSFPKTYGDIKIPGKLMIRVPSEVKAVAIPFEFQDVELP